MRSLRVFLIDKSSVFLQAAAGYLATLPDLLVVGKCQAEAEVLAEAERVEPDLIFFEVFAFAEGVSLVQHLHRLRTKPLVVVLTDHDEQPYRDLAARASADRYLLKSEFCLQVPGLLKKLSADRMLAPSGAGGLSV